MSIFANLLQNLMQKQQMQQQAQVPQPVAAPAPAPGNPFASVAQQGIPAGFFQSPQGQQMLAQLMGQQQPAAKRPPTPYVAPWVAQQSPGPAPSPAAKMGAVGGLGNGGGKMGIQATRFVKGY